MLQPHLSEQWSILKKFLSKSYLVYLDDVIIFGKNFEELIKNLRKILSRIWKVNLKINPKKCTFFDREVKYLGHSISAAEISTINLLLLKSDQFREIKNIYGAFWDYARIIANL